MNKESKEYKKVREKIARELHFLDWDKEVGMAYRHGDSGDWDEQDDYLHSHYFELADQILSIEGLAILDDDQSLPEVHYIAGDRLYAESEIKGMGKLLLANFRKVI